MTETEFREKHSEIIEYYQYIEMRLNGICAAILADKEKNWHQRLDDHDSDPLGKLIKLVRQLQSEKQIKLFSKEDFEALDELRKTRNYWVHQCFSDASHVTFHKGVMRRPQYGQRLVQDLQDAIMWDEKIVEIATPLFRSVIL